ncbi:MAG: hypothetical protein ACPG5P_00165 [Saprospiraceae bacterium]
MFHKRNWEYWTKYNLDSDPVKEGNIMYSGHLLISIL